MRLVFFGCALLLASKSWGQAHDKSTAAPPEAVGDNCWTGIPLARLLELKHLETKNFCDYKPILEKLAAVPDRCEYPLTLPNGLSIDQLQHHRLAARCMVFGPNRMCNDSSESLYFRDVRSKQRKTPRGQVFQIWQSNTGKVENWVDRRKTSTIESSDDAWFRRFEAIPGPMESKTALLQRLVWDLPGDVLSKVDSNSELLDNLWQQHLIRYCPSHDLLGRRTAVHPERVAKLARWYLKSFVGEKSLGHRTVDSSEAKVLAQRIKKEAWKGDCWPFLWSDIDPKFHRPKKYIFLVSGFSSFGSFDRPRLKVREHFVRDPSINELIWSMDEAWEAANLKNYNTVNSGDDMFDLNRSIMDQAMAGSVEVLHFPHDQQDKMLRCAKRIMSEGHLVDGKLFRSSVALVGYSNGGHAAMQVARSLHQSNLPLDGLVVIDGVPKIANQLISFGDEFKLPPNVAPNAVLNLFQGDDQTLFKRLLRGRAIKVENKENQKLIQQYKVDDTTHVGITGKVSPMVAEFLRDQVPFRVPLE